MPNVNWFKVADIAGKACTVIGTVLTMYTSKVEMKKTVEKVVKQTLSKR